MASSPPTRRPRNPSRTQSANQSAIVDSSDKPSALVKLANDAATPPPASSPASSMSMSSRRKPVTSMDSPAPRTAKLRKSSDKVLSAQSSSSSLPKPRIRTAESFQVQGSSSIPYPRRRATSTNTSDNNHSTTPNTPPSATSPICMSPVVHLSIHELYYELYADAPSLRRPSSASTPSSYLSQSTSNTGSSSRRPSVASTAPSSVHTPVVSRRPSLPPEPTIFEAEISTDAGSPEPSSSGTSPSHPASRMSKKVPPTIGVLHPAGNVASDGLTPTQSAMNTAVVHSPSRSHSSFNTPLKSTPQRLSSLNRASVATASPAHPSLQHSSSQPNQLRPSPASPLPLADMKQLLSRPASLVSGSASEDGRKRRSFAFTGSDNEGGRVNKRLSYGGSDTDEGGNSGYRSAPSQVVHRKPSADKPTALPRIATTDQKGHMESQRNRLYQSWEKERERVENMNSLSPGGSDKLAKFSLRKKSSNKKLDDGMVRRPGSASRSPLLSAPREPFRPSSSKGAESMTPAERVAMAYKERAQQADKKPMSPSASDERVNVQPGVKRTRSRGTEQKRPPSREKTSTPPRVVESPAERARSPRSPEPNQAGTYFTVAGSMDMNEGSAKQDESWYEPSSKWVAAHPTLRKASSSNMGSPVRSWVTTGNASPSPRSHSRLLSRKISIPRLGTSKEKLASQSPEDGVLSPRGQGRRQDNARLSFESPSRSGSGSVPVTSPTSSPARTPQAGSPSSGSGGIWKMLKKLSTGGLREKYHHRDTDIPPVPKLPENFDVYSSSPSSSRNAVKLSYNSLSSGTPAELSDSAGSTSTLEPAIALEPTITPQTKVSSAPPRHIPSRLQERATTRSRDSLRALADVSTRSSPIIPEFSTDAAINTFATTSKQSLPPTLPPLLPAKSHKRTSSTGQLSLSSRPRKSLDSASLAPKKREAEMRGRHSTSSRPSSAGGRTSSNAQFRKTESEAEKAAMWDELMARSARAGGTLHLDSNAALPSDDMSSMRNSVAASDVTIMG